MDGDVELGAGSPPRVNTSRARVSIGDADRGETWANASVSSTLPLGRTGRRALLQQSGPGPCVVRALQHSSDGITGHDEVIQRETTSQHLAEVDPGVREACDREVVTPDDRAAAQPAVPDAPGTSHGPPQPRTSRRGPPGPAATWAAAVPRAVRP